MAVTKIVSGGQTGVDRAALDLAMVLGLPAGGWCPRGRLAEDGALPEVYSLIETPLSDYEQRTEWNVRDSDGTLIIARGELTGGTALTLELAERMGKPHLTLDLASSPSATAVSDWIEQLGIRTLNVAGPRESLRPGIYDQAKEFLKAVLLIAT